MSELQAMQITIHAEPPDTVDGLQLIAELEAELAPLYPPESQHGYSVAQMIEQRVAFFVIRVNGEPAGCGGIQFYPDYGELKRMYVRPTFRGMGLAQRLIDHLSAYANSRHCRLLRLETGILQHAAIRCYEKAGFYRIGPFGNYPDDPLSLFYERRLDDRCEHAAGRSNFHGPVAQEPNP
ncbi:GNAT family N-acetyltransferase [Chloroflexus sp.]|uniref:GNAT family N-acetyltransferase n=1 Tax=Chloroflexus sp. TaxID=1904827 RepID=UPI00262403A5|nr:GNAT family N-acetyltransferase [uncultured Chloroflexus sp.]